MNRTTILSLTALSLTLISGCATAADQQLKANDAQSEANHEVRETNADANAKNDASQADANEAQHQANHQVNETNADANAKNNASQANADVDIASAQAKFMSLREDYRHQTTVNLAGIDASITELEAARKKATGQKWVALEKSLSSIKSARASFVTHYGEIETASAVNWDAVKARLDAELSELKKLVDRG